MGILSFRRHDKVSLEGFETADSFINRWDEIRLRDRPGVYTILIFKKPRDVNSNSYISAYAGQSMTVYHRLHNHLTGKGNGDVYADYRGGMYVLVRVELCEPDMLNELEKERIQDLDPDRRYNITTGGAKLREDSEGRVSVRCRITLVRLSKNSAAYLAPKVLLDGIEVGKIPNGGKLNVSTTEGFHSIKLISTGTKPFENTFDFRDGDKLIIESTLTGWRASLQ